MIIFPAIDILNGEAVRLTQGKYDHSKVYNPDPLSQARLFEEQGAKWLHIVDLNAARSGEASNATIIKNIAANTKLNLQVGGGIRNISSVERMLNIGVKRVVLGTALAKNPEFAIEAAAKYGDSIVAGIDALSGHAMIQGWEEDSKEEAEELVSALTSMGIWHLVYTDISKDGMQSGIDAAAYKRVSEVAGFSVVVSGGVSNLDDLHAIKTIQNHIEGVIIGRAIYEESIELVQAFDILGVDDGAWWNTSAEKRAAHRSHMEGLI